MAATKNTHPTAPDPVKQDEELRKPAEIAEATTFEMSGAPQQMESLGIDPSHPAVDSNPRANTTVLQNRIDFNDPTLEAHEAVAKNLADQGQKL